MTNFSFLDVRLFLHAKDLCTVKSKGFHVIHVGALEACEARSGYFCSYKTRSQDPAMTESREASTLKRADCLGLAFLLRYSAAWATKS